jgi:hypothetical protein
MTFAATTQSDYVTFLKEWYRGAVVADLTYDNHPFLGLVPKDTDVRGNTVVNPIRYSNTTGRSNTFAKAHANVGAASRERWEQQHISNYSKAAVENKVMVLSEGSDAAFQQALTDEIDAAHGAFANDLDFEIHSDGTGARGIVVDTIDTLVVDLDTARNFEVGMVVQHTDTDDALLNSGDEVTITAVNRTSVPPTITLSADWSTTTIATHKIIQSGDAAAKVDGLAAWLPGSGVSADPFNGVVRTADPSRLAGLDGVKGTTSTLLITDALIQTGAQLMKEGGSPNLALLAPVDFADLALETEARGRYAKLGATSGNLSFSALEIQTGAGAVPCVSDPQVLADTLFMLDTRVISLFSAGELPSLFNRDGSFYHRSETADEISFYLYGFYNMIVKQPGRCAFLQDVY